MARHLRSCEKRQQTIAAADAKPGQDGTFIHLQVQDAYGGPYWLQLEMDGAATLKKLDSYLRAIWLECCGHMSQFSTGGWGGRQIGMGRKAADVLQPGVELTHIYDFGTSTETLIKAVDAREGKSTVSKPIALMARNDPPSFTCMECGNPATSLCMECVYEENRSGMLCEKHAEEHPHDDYGGLFAVVNSPRMGECGYSGPAEPPY
ncbi:MAG TPA: hypothetical protein VGR27_03580 [Longimicrobiaceae bacterium]|nr:hypothetical protein [Longimicrobiaceae bacterium]